MRFAITRRPSVSSSVSSVFSASSPSAVIPSSSGWITLTLGVAFIAGIRVDFRCPLLVLVGCRVLVLRSACSFLGLGSLAPGACSLFVRRRALLLSTETAALRLFPVLPCFYAPLLELPSSHAWQYHQEDEDQDDDRDDRDYEACAHCRSDLKICVTDATYP